MSDEIKAAAAAASDIEAPAVAAPGIEASRPRWSAPKLQTMSLAETRNSGTNPDGSISIGPVS